MSIGNGKKETLVEEGTEFQGTMKSACPVVVNGSLDGTIEAPALTVSAVGKVLGTVHVEQLKSDGTLAGNIDADQVSLSGTVHSETVIRARSLEVKLAAESGKLEVTFGECNLAVGDEPSLETDVSSEANGKTSASVANGKTSASVANDKTSASVDDDKENAWSQPPPPN